MVLTSQLQYRSKESWHSRLETRIYRKSRIGARVSSIKNRESRIETLVEIFEDLDDSFEETISFSLAKQ